MIDPNSQFFAILTAVGEAKQANADALGIPWKLTDLGVGDANGADPIPDRAQTKLINERRRRPLNKLSVDPANPNIIVAEQIIPADEGGWWIREIGLYDSDGALVAVANCAPSYKPLMSQGSGRTQVVRMNFIVSSAANVVLKIDPAVVLATRQYVDETTTDAINRQDIKQSVLVATTGPIQLAGSPTVDGVVVPLGSRVLVKDQAQAKDNGIYVTADIWKRATDADTSVKVTPGLLVAVEKGALNADSLWLLSTDGAIVLGTTALTFKNVTQGLAPLNSPALSGIPTAPTSPRFDNSTAVATSEWVRRQGKYYSGSTAFNGGGSILAAAVGQVSVLFGDAANTIYLPDSSDLPLGATVTIVCYNTVSAAITRVGTDLIYGADPGQSVSVKSVLMLYGDTLEVSLLGNRAWYVTGGTVAVKYSAQFAASLSGPTCYKRLPNGGVEQWGFYASAPSGGDVVLTLPVAMSAEPTKVQLTFANFNGGEVTGASPVLQARSISKGTITVRNLHSAPASFFWVVEGKA